MRIAAPLTYLSSPPLLAACLATLRAALTPARPQPVPAVATLATRMQVALQAAARARR